MDYHNKLIEVIKSVQSVEANENNYYINCWIDTNQVDILTAGNYNEANNINAFDVDAGEKRRRLANGIPEVTRASDEDRENFGAETFPLTNTTRNSTTAVTHVNTVPTAPVSSTKKGPAYKIRSMAEMEPMKRPVELAMMNARVDMPLQDFLGMSKEGADFMHKVTTRRRIPVDQLSQDKVVDAVVEDAEVVVAPPKSVDKKPYSVRAVRINGRIRNKDVIICIDLGSELNVANTEFLQDLNIPISPDSNTSLVGATRGRMNGAGVAWNVPVQIKDFFMNVPALAVNDFKYTLLLGLPFLEEAKWTVSEVPDGRRMYEITDEDTSCRYWGTGVGPVVKGGSLHMLASGFNSQVLHTLAGVETSSAGKVEVFKTALKEVDAAFTFDDSEMGLLKIEVENPIRIPTVEHTPWEDKPFPIPCAIYYQVIQLIKSKIAAGVLEPSIGGYANKWFVILKKDQSKLQFIQDLLIARTKQLMMNVRICECAGMMLDDARLITKVYYDACEDQRKTPLMIGDM
ncbi:hypothetical protein H4219_005659, partial [Mycoemilia scoparia]